MGEDEEAANGGNGDNVRSGSVGSGNRVGPELEREGDSPDSMSAEEKDDDDGKLKVENEESGRGRRKRSSVVEPLTMRRWEADYQLEQIDRLHLFDEYIEMGEILFHVFSVYLYI